MWKQTRDQGRWGGGSANPEQGKERKLAAATLLMLLLVAPRLCPTPTPGQEESRGRKEKEFPTARVEAPRLP